MSLINDALKRAKQAQAPAPPAVALSHLRHADPAPRVPGRAVLIIALLTGSAMGVSLFIAWRAFLAPDPANNPRPTRELSQSEVPKNIAARSELIAQTPRGTASTPNTPSAPEITSTPEKFSQTLASTSERNAPEASSATPAVTPSAPLPPTSPRNSVPDGSPLLSAPPAPSKSEPLKLQGIVFNPKRPAAMIAGKMLFVGDKLGEWRVSAITPDSATLITASQTNTLTLPQ